MSHFEGNATTMHEARAWINDCQWADIDDADELTDQEVYDGIRRHYDGGWRGFLENELIIEPRSPLTDEELFTLHIAA